MQPVRRPYGLPGSIPRHFRVSWFNILMLDLSLRYQNNGTAHDDIHMHFAGQTLVGDSYYFALDRNVRPDDESADKVRAVLRELLQQWLRAASNLPDGRTAFLPYDFSDQSTGWLCCQRNENEMVVSLGWAEVQGHSIFPSAVGDYFSNLPGFKVEGPTMKASRDNLLQAICDSLVDA